VIEKQDRTFVSFHYTRATIYWELISGIDMASYINLLGKWWCCWGKVVLGMFQETGGYPPTRFWGGI